MSDRERQAPEKATENDFQEFLVLLEMTLKQELEAWLPFYRNENEKRELVLSTQEIFRQNSERIRELIFVGENMLWSEAQDIFDDLNRMVTKAYNLDNFILDSGSNKRYYRLFVNPTFFVSSLVLYSFLESKAKNYSHHFTTFLDKDDRTEKTPLNELVLKVFREIVNDNDEPTIKVIQKKFIKYDRYRKLGEYRSKLKLRLLGENRSGNKAFVFEDEEDLKNTISRIDAYSVEFVYNLILMRYQFININPEACHRLRVSKDKHSLEARCILETGEEEKVHEIFFSREDKEKRKLNQSEVSRKRYGTL